MTGRITRVEKDPGGGWIARRRNGEIFYDANWRWNSRSVARSVVRELDFAEDATLSRESSK